MNKYQTYSLIGKILALDILPSNRELIIGDLQNGNIQWERFVALTDHHLVLQVLYHKITDHQLENLFPEEVVEHLKYIFDLTTTRNIEVVKQSEKLNTVLKNAGIVPLFMKGVGNILDGLYKYPGERILHDIDILVAEKDYLTAAEVLMQDGYRSNYAVNPEVDSRHRHMPILFKPGEPIYVELHRMAVGRKFNKFFTPEMIFGSAKKSASNPECLVMSDEHNIIHNFIHAQLDHQAHIYARESLRNLYDLLLLSERQNPEKVLYDFGHFRRISSGYLDITYNSFGIIPSKRNLPKLFLHSYLFRHKLNMKSRFVGIMSLFLIRVFFGYVVTPIMAIGNKELRVRLIAKVRSADWYKKQWEYYRRVLGFRRRKN